MPLGRVAAGARLSRGVDQVSAVPFVGVAGQPLAASSTQSSRRRSMWHIVLILALCQPYLRWLGIGTPSQVQLYPGLLSAAYLMHSLKTSPIRDPLMQALTIAAIPVALVQMAATSEGLFIALRGVFGYLSLGIVTWAWVWILRRVGPETVSFALKVSFWAWVGLGAIQLVSPGFGVFWRTRLVISHDRGAISFASEPAYFSFALLLTATALLLIEHQRKYLIYAFLASMLIAQSAIGSIYCAGALLFVSRMSIAKKISLVPVGFGVWLALNEFLPRSRIVRVLGSFASDPMGLFENDRSAGARYITIVLPFKSFWRDYGRPHTLGEWSTVLAEYGGVTEVTSGRRIMAIHPQLLFELGVYAVVYYALFWAIIRRSNYRRGLAVLGVLLFFNGVTLNSPFLALVLACAYSAPSLTHRARLHGFGDSVSATWRPKRLVVAMRRGRRDGPTGPLPDRSPLST